MRLLAALMAVPLGLLASRSACAAESFSAQDASKVDALTIGGTLSNAWIRESSSITPYDSDASLQLSFTYRLKERFAVGAVGSFSPAIGSESQFWRISGEARAFAVSNRFVELWASSELGVAISKYAPNPCGDCGAPLNDPFKPRFAPLVGVGFGADLFPLRYVSVGVEGRALGSFFVTEPVDEGPSGVTPVFMVGLTVAGRVPFANR